MVRLLMEKEENATTFEDFPLVHNSAVFLRKLFEKELGTNNFLEGRENEVVYHNSGGCSFCKLFWSVLFCGLSIDGFHGGLSG